jgi:hypothetical protein
MFLPAAQAAIVKGEEAKAQNKADAAKAIKDECEADLAEVSGRGRRRSWAQSGAFRLVDHERRECASAGSHEQVLGK